MARRWLALDEEIKGHDAHLDTRTATLAPEMVRAHGIGTATAAEMLILDCDNPERIRPKAMRTWPRLQSWAEPARSRRRAERQ
jgi:transposase